jgi:hypothetical protein
MKVRARAVSAATRDLTQNGTSTRTVLRSAEALRRGTLLYRRVTSFGVWFGNEQLRRLGFLFPLRISSIAHLRFPFAAL